MEANNEFLKLKDTGDGGDSHKPKRRKKKKTNEKETQEEEKVSTKLYMAIVRVVCKYWILNVCVWCVWGGGNRWEERKKEGKREGGDKKRENNYYTRRSGRRY